MVVTYLTKRTDYGPETTARGHWRPLWNGSSSELAVVNSPFQPQPLGSLSLFAMFLSNERLSYMLAFRRQKSLFSYWTLLYSSIDNHIISHSFSPLSEKTSSILFNYPPQFSIYLPYSQLQEIYITSTKLIIEFSPGPYILEGEYCVQTLALLKRDVIWHRWLRNPVL